jgi:hypothetical protein
MYAAENRTRELPYFCLPFYRLSYPTHNIYCAIYRCRVIKYIACLQTAAHVQIEMSPVHPVKLAYNFSAWDLRVHAINTGVMYTCEEYLPG